LFVAGVFDFEDVGAGVTCFTVENDVVFSEGFFTDTFELVFVLFFGGFVFEGEGSGYFADPGGTEG